MNTSRNQLIKAAKMAISAHIKHPRPKSLKVADNGDVPLPEEQPQSTPFGFIQLNKGK